MTGEKMKRRTLTLYSSVILLNETSEASFFEVAKEWLDPNAGVSMQK